MEFDPTKNRFHNKKGVHVQSKDGLPGIEYLDTDHKKPLLKPFVDYYVKNLGYKRGKSIRGATYDWRLAARKDCIHACVIRYSATPLLSIYYLSI